MNELKVVEITLSDLEETRQILSACLNYFTAQDLSEAQMRLEVYRKSPLTDELGRIKDRMDGYLGDFLLAQYEDEHGEIPQDDVEIDVDFEEPAEIVVEEALKDNPLGTVTVQRQKGRRLSKEEIAGDE